MFYSLKYGYIFFLKSFPFSFFCFKIIFRYPLFFLTPAHTTEQYSRY
ncbi:hypothetical protein ACIN5109_A0042 (plasmid) [Acinetobacter baumannii OIFC109]|nr:hypothetical protein ACIN5109_A0042 [Acinetobacter baumannii OIFC109]